MTIEEHAKLHEQKIRRKTKARLAAAARRKKRGLLAAINRMQEGQRA